MSSSFAPSLGSDNHAGVHPTILEMISKLNSSHAPSYGTDEVSRQLNSRFQKLFSENCQAYLVFNGTAANVLSVRTLIPSWRSVLCTDVSHLQLDECGAPEAMTGSKLQLVPSVHGKLRVRDLEAQMIRLGDQHYSAPGMISITQPTELGTVYSFDEMKQLREFANRHHLRLHIDGARLSNCLVTLGCDYKDLYEALEPDAVSFGGTKNGLMGAEAVLLFEEESKRKFKYIRKQMMQLPSKTRFLAAQFEAYFQNNLYKEISNHSHQMAKRLEEGLMQIPQIEILYPVESNAVFATIPRSWTKTLRQRMFFYIWDESKWSIRLMPSFDSTPGQIDSFLALAKELSDKTISGDKT